ncbi:MAG: nucleoside hydrolase [Acidimicrobiia bacterium]|nr:nucleoside hydrolase [Acidimicrobiia bacterium]MYG59589.1 nucleoside hydrolase [Acidimicrobiia bacterium]MYH97043.1 nucleoside hydrolase [Acidimicrobiia bacterium]MYJ31673.1 nucleoside hydrolase [Acidimicrobiia bacterium]MYL08740.1 nucleoside hydrolase [Acidimicrobiia bacterium]
MTKNPTGPRPIIIDTDPGQDDAIAILAALASDELEVLGLTAVAGNVPLELTARNALILVELAGRPDVPVFAGCDRPLRRDLVTAEHVHGKTGIDGADLPDPTTELQPQSAVDWMIETLLAAGEREITICPVGPMTNIATVLETAPEAARNIREIVCMGGGFFDGGNTTPTAEFNVFVDPEAAQIVLHCGAPVTMLPLDVTHKALMTDAWINQVRNLGTRTGSAAAGMLDFYERFDVDKYGTFGGPLHDPNVIAYLLRPDLYSGRHCNVEVETESPLTMGMTVVDWWDVTDRPANCQFITEVDSDGFYELLLNLLARLP